MLDRDNWNEILEALTANTFRTILTAFGVFWGIFILVILLAAGNGLENGVKKGFDVNLVDHRVFVPERVFDKGGCLGFLGHCKLLKIQSSRGSFPHSA